MQDSQPSSSSPGIVGLDIGGANLKLAATDGHCVTRCFEIWKAPEQLPEQLRGLLQTFPFPAAIAVTLTAELADCFATKAEGVSWILAAVEEVAGLAPVRVWSTRGEFLTPSEARAEPLAVAAANWHALATWAGRWLPEPHALLIDIGSTTSDVIPLQAGMPVPAGLTDSARLIAGELVYTGVRRTPLCALALAVPFRGDYCPVAAEWFATTLDVYLTLGQIPSDPADRQTANRGPATRDAAHDRLARMLCCDRSEFTAAEAESLAQFFAGVQQRRVSAALSKVLSRQRARCESVLISGSGRFLARQIVAAHPRLQDCRLVDLGDKLDAGAAEAACALAVATLAAER